MLLINLNVYITTLTHIYTIGDSNVLTTCTKMEAKEDIVTIICISYIKYKTNPINKTIPINVITNLLLITNYIDKIAMTSIMY